MKFWDSLRNCQSIWWLVLTALSAVVIISPLLPLGVPEEWTWTRHPLPTTLVGLLDRLLAPAAGALLLAGTAIFGRRRLQTCHAAGRLGLLLALCLVTACWQTAVQQAAPSPHREVKPWWIVYDRYASGYFAEAAFRIPSARQLLQGYEARMREGDVLHIGTHPPGLFLISLAALQLTQQSPALVSLLEALRSPATEQAFRQLEGLARQAHPLTQTQLAALQLVSWLSALAAACAVIPVYCLAGRLSLSSPHSMPHNETPQPSAAFDHDLAWLAACLYATLPAVAVFFPKSDVLYPLTATAFLWFSVAAVQAQRVWQQCGWALLSAVTLFSGCLLSLAHVPVVVALGLLLLLRNAQRQFRQFTWRPTVVAVTAGTVLFAACVLIWNAVTDCNLLTVWKLNLTNHAGFYDQSPRTWWRWCLVNPAELGLAVGLPLFAAAVCSWLRSLSSLLHSWSNTGQGGSWRATFVSATALTWTALWLSGKNMGEAARLWCFLTPWLAIAAAVHLKEGSPLWRPPEHSADARPGCDADTGWRVLLVCQLATAIVTVGRVNGFSV